MATAVTDQPGANRWLNRLLGVPRAAVGIALGLPLVAGGLLLWQASLLADILHRAVVEGAALPALTGTIVVLAAVFAVRIGLCVAGEIAATRASEAIKQRLREALVRDFLGRQPVWTAARSSGALSGLVVEQVEALDGYFARYLPAMVQAAILPLAFAVVMFPIDWVVGLLFLVTAPLIPLFMALAGWGAEAATRAQAGALLRLSSRFADRLRGLVTLKLFGRAEAETAAVRSASEELRLRTMRVMRIAFLSSAVLEFFAALGVAGVALYVGLTFLDLVSLRGTELTLAAGLFCLLMAPEVYQPLRLLAANYHDRAAARAATEELAAMLGELPQVDAAEPPPAVTASVSLKSPPAVELDDVSVAAPTGRPVIEKARLRIDAGTHVAILGPSGCGKSTLIESIARLRDWNGDITLGGQPLAAIEERVLRAAVAFLGQRSQLFSGTIAENIRLGRPDACPTAVRIAARRACVDRFATGLPLGLETPVGDNGFGLSGGEVQRVALGRIYLRDPGLIMLDEPTAHLDPETEADVLDGLLEFARNRTLVVATHSDAVAARMQRVYRIARGRPLPAVRPAAAVPPAQHEVAA